MIVDGADNFPTRYLVNDASVWHGIPVVHGSIFRFEGQVTVFEPDRGPVLPLPLPVAAAAGARAELRRGRRARRPARHHRLAPGERGAQARPRHRRRRLYGRLLLFDALVPSFTEVVASPRSGMPRLRRVAPTITEYIDYVEFCQGDKSPRMSTVRIPPPLRDATNGEATVAARRDDGARPARRPRLALPRARRPAPLCERLRRRRGHSRSRRPRDARRRLPRP